MKYYGLHWTSDDGTEIQIRIALENLELWARSCPRGGEWTAWRRLDVLRGTDGILLETTREALFADNARKAESAAKADLAARASTAGLATLAENAKRAENAASADTAARAETADSADTAKTAETAKRLAMAVTIALEGTVAGSALFDGAGNTTIRTRPGREIADIQAALARLQQVVDGLAGSLDGINGANSGLASRLDELEKRLAALESGDGDMDLVKYRLCLLLERLKYAEAIKVDLNNGEDFDYYRSMSPLPGNDPAWQNWCQGFDFGGRPVG